MLREEENYLISDGKLAFGNVKSGRGPRGQLSPGHIRVLRFFRSALLCLTGYGMIDSGGAAAEILWAAVEWEKGRSSIPFKIEIEILAWRLVEIAVEHCGRKIGASYCILPLFFSPCFFIMMPSERMSTMVNPAFLQLVSDEYSKLQGAIDDLGSSVSATLGRQNKDLQLTHEREMMKLQLALETTAKEKIRLEESIATNERACQLETERDWYRKEALALDQAMEQMKVKQKELAERLDESEQDRGWLKGNVEKLRMRNSSLEEKFKEFAIDVSVLHEEEGILGLGKNSVGSPANSEKIEKGSAGDSERVEAEAD